MTLKVYNSNVRLVMYNIKQTYTTCMGVAMGGGVSLASLDRGSLGELINLSVNPDS